LDNQEIFAMKLTRRQEEFVRMMIELKQELDGPVHNSLLAERLGISPFTAYDMLCLLEEKGYVASTYQLPTDKSGPGRAERVFYPGAMALAHAQRMTQETGGRRLEGEELEEFILEKLHSGVRLESDPELVRQLMARLLPTGQGNVRYCVEVMTIAVLRLQHNPARQTLLEHLPYILTSQQDTCQANLCFLGGFVFGVLAQQNAPGPEWLNQLRDHLQAYFASVMQMDRQECAELTLQLTHVFAVLGEV